MRKNHRVIDLFAGAGGFSLGFLQAGFNVDTAIEVDLWACQTLRRNHPRLNILKEDITTISDSRISDLGLQGHVTGIIGGPPCQGFSHSNIAKKDALDPRNSLFIHFARFVRILRPEFFVIENVPGLARTRLHSGEMALDIILNTFRGLGYKTEYRLLRAEHFGVPQIRERLFMVGSIDGTIKDPLPTGTHTRATLNAPSLFDSPDMVQSVTLWDAISDLPHLEAGDGTEPMKYPSESTNVYQTALRKNSTALWNHIAMRHSKRVVERFKQITIGQSQSDVGVEYAPRVRSNGHLASTKRYDQNNRRLDPNLPSHTIPASFYANFVHPFQNRNFTAREGARIQSFPDNYVFCGKPTVVSQKLLAREGRTEEKFLCQYNQIGNAVPPLLAKAIAANLISQI